MRRLLLFIFIFTSTVVFSQRKISGVISSSEDKETLIGATILVKGTSIGTITNFDGTFELEVPENAVLVISYIGMTNQEIPIKDQTTFTIVLNPESVSLTEVVVVAYGTQRKDRFNGSVATVKSSDLEIVPVASVDKMLQGNVPGLMATSSSGQPGAASEIRIRGAGSITASNEPLYVIDGMPVESGSIGTTKSNAMSMINPSDIESISVLKDAAAASLYGSRAANGVVLITTKQGKKGETKFSFRTSQGFSSKADDNYRSLNSQEYVGLRKVALQNAGYSLEQANNMAGSDAINTNWNNEIFRPAMFSNYDLSASGGDEKTKFFVSGSFVDQDGIVIGSGLKRGSSRVNLTHEATTKLTIGTNTTLSYSLQNATKGSGDLSNPVLAADFIPSNVPVKNADGTYNYNFAALNGQNPVGLSKVNINETQTARLLNNTFLQYKITPDLTFKTTWGIDYLDPRELYFLKSVRDDGINGLGERKFNRKLSWSSSNSLKYIKKINDNHNIEALAVYERYYFRKEYSGMTAKNYPNDRMPELVNAAEAVGTPFSYVNQSTLISYLGELQYNYKQRYYLSSSLRTDGSSRFAAGHRYGVFYSLGGSWRVNDEEFLKNIRQINSLKLRSSYGTSGNSEINDFASRGLYAFTSYNGQPSMYPKQIQYDLLTWEKCKAFNIAIDANIFNRFVFTIEYYNRVTSDLLLNVPISTISGYENQFKNVGSMVNKGWEFSLTSENIKGGDFIWNTNFNTSINTNKVLQLNNNEDIIVDNNVQINRIGEDISSYYLRKWAGVNPADGSPMWYDKNGNVVYNYLNADKQIVGSSAPKLFGAITNNLSWKNIEFSIMFFYNYGNKIYDTWAGYTQSDGTFITAFNQNADQLNYWKNPGDMVPNPKPVWQNTSSSNVSSTRYMHDGSYIRLRNLSLAYTLPKTWMEKAKLRSCKIYISGQNLWTLSRYQGHDVERGSNGFNDAAFPNLKTITIGAELGF